MGTKRVFELTPEQDDQIAAWIRDHQCSEVAKRSLHRSFTYCFTPTGIGDAQKVVCSACKKELDLTDVSTW
jgi:hexokinase